MIELSAMLVGDIQVAKNTSVTIYNYDLDCHCPDSVLYECGLLLKTVCMLRNAAQSPARHLPAVVSALLCLFGQ